MALQKKSGVYIAIGFLALVGYLLYSSLSIGGYKVEVCKEFAGRQACRIANGSSEESALRTATENACALISSGVTDSIACQNSPAVSTKWITRP